MCHLLFGWPRFFFGFPGLCVLHGVFYLVFPWVLRRALASVVLLVSVVLFFAVCTMFNFNIWFLES